MTDSSLYAQCQNKVFLVTDYSNDHVSAAVFHKKKCLADMKADHRTVNFLEIITQTISIAGLNKNDLQLIITTNGPGSFTAIRIALTTNYGLSIGLKIPLVTINSLQATASCCLTPKNTVLSLIKAYQGELFVAAYKLNDKRVVETWPAQVIKPQQLFNCNFSYDIIIGNGMHWLQQSGLEQNLTTANSVQVKDFNIARCLGELASRYYVNYSHNQNPQPLYLKLPTAELNFSQKQL